ncbi:hypothetical protein CLAIMM_00726 [Cladophialophora immunda]|nr:hypothetical protein CLAIMM_00726 [Cladophialophora immunda]
MGSSAQVALVTGGASGMGLGVVEDLVQKGWNVAIVDVDARMGHSAEERLGTQVLFIRANVADYNQQAEAFSQTWAQWGRLDLVLANAGILDRMDITAPGKEMANGAPAKPDTLAVDICLYGVIYAAYLALHYFRKNANGKGNLVFTSSQGGIYPVAMAPLYGAAKTGASQLYLGAFSPLPRKPEMSN